MYHIAKILKVLEPDNKSVVSADKITVAMIRTWDENTLILAVDENIVGKLKEGDFVLADYRLRDNSPSPRHLITKILKSDVGKELWDVATAHLEEMKKRSGMQAVPAAKLPQQYR